MYTVKEVSQRLHISIFNLRDYCNLGLVPNLQRDANGTRQLDDESLNWIKAVQFFRECGMSLQEIKRYFAFCLSDEDHLDERYQVIKQLKGQAEREWSPASTGTPFCKTSSTI